MNSTASLLIFSPHHGPALTACVLHYTPTSPLGRSLPSLRSVYPSVSLLLSNAKGGTGISTCCPSPTAFALGLGPDLPWEDEPSPGILRLSTAKILTLLSLLMPAFSLPYSPRSLTLPLLLLPVFVAPLPNSLKLLPRFRCVV